MAKTGIIPDGRLAMHRLAFNQITIVGTGLLGGSIGLALRACGFRGGIIGVGRRQDALREAAEAGCIDRPAMDLAEGVAGSDLIVLAAPIGAIQALLGELGAIETDGAVITDVGSTKKTIVETAERVLSDPGPFVGSHPMAGGECSGPAAARADLLSGKPVVVTPTPGTRPDALERVEGLWRALGMRVLRMEPGTHDRAVARVSHLPHAVAALLVLTAEGEAEPDGDGGGAAPLEVASTGFADTTRVAGGDPELWADIFLDNREAMLETLEGWAMLTGRFRQFIEGEDREGLVRLLRQAREARRDWAARQDDPVSNE